MSSNRFKPPIGPVTRIMTQRAFQREANDELGRTKLEIIIDRVIEAAGKGDNKAQKLLFRYLQPDTQITPELAVNMLSEIPTERLAQLFGMTITALKREEERYLLTGETEIIEVEDLTAKVQELSKELSEGSEPEKDEEGEDATGE